jgi:hypothetical protein
MLIRSEGGAHFMKRFNVFDHFFNCDLTGCRFLPPARMKMLLPGRCG